MKKTDGKEAEAAAIEREMDGVVMAMRGIGPCLSGTVKKGPKVKYTKKDGTVSEYGTAPILQYRAGPKKRAGRRIPEGRVAEVERLLASGRRYRELAARYEAPAARLALLFQKKT
jgi:hypothetical protein